MPEFTIKTVFEYSVNIDISFNNCVIMTKMKKFVYSSKADDKAISTKCHKITDRQNAAIGYYIMPGSNI
ncbi:MAG: hypothetical protein CVU91_04745 [Firmicutes bacterium HGW-Firmicutes-16]|nr:MAG: hypothetical protein CVU91_04745 [Firmicutes bacterium HGW-Firmicutes-16]